jgi:ATP:corrinoid adenosyltransferase
MRYLYLAATGQNRGKTTASLGLVAASLDAERMLAAAAGAATPDRRLT